MSKTEKDQEILRLITTLYVDIYNFTKEWHLPDDHNALINFIGRGMMNFQNGTKKIDYNHLDRNASFSVDSVSKLALKIVLRALQIGRQVNKIRISQNRPTIDWYSRAVEEDGYEDEQRKTSTNEIED